jgi:hypothetical protein
MPALLTARSVAELKMTPVADLERLRAADLKLMTREQITTVMSLLNAAQMESVFGANYGGNYSDDLVTALGKLTADDIASYFSMIPNSTLPLVPVDRLWKLSPDEVAIGIKSFTSAQIAFMNAGQLLLVTDQDLALLLTPVTSPVGHLSPRLTSTQITDIFKRSTPAHGRALLAKLDDDDVAQATTDKIYRRLRRASPSIAWLGTNTFFYQTLWDNPRLNARLVAYPNCKACLVTPTMATNSFRTERELRTRNGYALVVTPTSGAAFSYEDIPQELFFGDRLSLYGSGPDIAGPFTGAGQKERVLDMRSITKTSSINLYHAFDVAGTTLDIDLSPDWELDQGEYNWGPVWTDDKGWGAYVHVTNKTTKVQAWILLPNAAIGDELLPPEPRVRFHWTDTSTRPPTSHLMEPWWAAGLGTNVSMWSVNDDYNSPTYGEAIGTGLVGVYPRAYNFPASLTASGLRDANGHVLDNEHRPDIVDPTYYPPSSMLYRTSDDKVPTPKT